MYIVLLLLCVMSCDLPGSCVLCGPQFIQKVPTTRHYKHRLFLLFKSPLRRWMLEIVTFRYYFRLSPMGWYTISVMSKILTFITKNVGQAGRVGTLWMDDRVINEKWRIQGFFFSRCRNTGGKGVLIDMMRSILWWLVMVGRATNGRKGSDVQPGRLWSRSWIGLREI